MRRILLGIFGIVFVFVLTLFIKSGAWKPVEITEVERGPLNLIYKDFVGPYHKVIATMQEVESWATTNKLNCKKTFGRYLDDPNVVDHDRLRSQVGCLLETIPQNLPPEIKSMTIPPKKYVVGTFSGSPALGPLKVYGKVENYMENRKLQTKEPIIEIYEMKSDNQVTSEYLFTVE